MTFNYSFNCALSLITPQAQGNVELERGKDSPHFYQFRVSQKEKVIILIMNYNIYGRNHSVTENEKERVCLEWMVQKGLSEVLILKPQAQRRAMYAKIS